MQKIICNKCGSENNEEYSFCVVCGEPLVKPEPKQPEPCSASVGNDTYGEQFSSQRCDGSIGNMPIAAAVDFVGTNSNYYIPKFKKFDASSSSSSWNWPVALFSFLLGMPFIWFFYRKMYKLGSIILAAYSLLFIVDIVCGLQIVSTFFEFIKPFVLQSLQSQTGELSYELEQQLSNGILSFGSQMAIPSAISNITTFVSLGLNVYLSIAANGLYMKHMLKTFNNAAIKNPNGVSPYLLRSLGGTSTGAAVGIAIGFVVLTSIISMATVGACLIDFFSELVETAMSITY